MRRLFLSLTMGLIVLGSGLLGTTQAEAACSASDTRLCLLNGRFSATLKWNDGSGLKDAYVAGPKTDSASSAAGLFYFYAADPSNWEILTKMIDGCGTNNHFWVLTAASTGFGWELKIKDESQGTTKTFTHPLDGQASGIADFEAFATCGSTPPPTPTPAPSGCSSSGPITDFRRDCSDYVYIYLSGNRLVGAGVSSDGTVAAVCITDGDDIICAGGLVQSATQAALSQANLNGGPYLPLGAGSFVRIRNSGVNLDVRLIIQGQTTDLFGFIFEETDPLAPTSDPRSSAPLGHPSTERVVDSVRAFLSSASPSGEQNPGVAEAINRLGQK
jgi:hypothetical protein